MVFFILLAFGLSGCRDDREKALGQCVNSTDPGAQYRVNSSAYGDLRQWVVAPDESWTMYFKHSMAMSPYEQWVSFNGVAYDLSSTPSTVDFEGCQYWFKEKHRSRDSEVVLARVVDIPITDAALSNLAIRTGSSGTLSAESLSPAFSVVTPAYSITVPYAKSQISITPTARQASATPSATITVNGAGVTSGSASPPIDLNVGANTIPVLVTSPNERKTYTYTVNVIRSRDHRADLSALTIGSGTLTPGFDSGVTSYAVSVLNAVTSMTVTPTVAASGATVMVNSQSVTSGSGSGVIQLSIGNNTIPIVVTATDQTTKTYTVTVTRAAVNADLSALTISSGTLTPAFSSAVTSYTVSVPNAVASVTFTPTVAALGSMVGVSGGPSMNSGIESSPIAIATGSNTIGIYVSSEDNAEIKFYFVTVIRAAN